MLIKVFVAWRRNWDQNAFRRIGGQSSISAAPVSSRPKPIAEMINRGLIADAAEGRLKSGAQVDFVSRKEVRRLLAVFKGRNEPQRHFSCRGEFAARPIVRDYD